MRVQRGEETVAEEGDNSTVRRPAEGAPPRHSLRVSPLGRGANERTQEKEGQDDVPAGVTSRKGSISLGRPSTYEKGRDHVEVVNLSNRHLTDSELSLLGKGFSFVPTKRQSVAQPVSN